MPKIVVAPDSFKGCLSAGEAASAIASSIRELRPGWEVVEQPLADGGEGTLAVIMPALLAKIVSFPFLRSAKVSDPLGRPVMADYLLAGDTAVIEVSKACGLNLLSPQERNPLAATTRGVGELLLEARRRGAVRFIIGLGGTSTCDGGAGMMGVPSLREALEGCSIELLSDVDNPFVGSCGAARVFAPQKGASAADVEILERRMLAEAGKILSETGVDVRELPGSGAAGGLGGALMAYFGAVMHSGAGKILDLVGFDELIKDADLIITGEGKSDIQTLSGKVPYGVLKRSVDPVCGRRIPVALLSGRITDRRALHEAGFGTIIQISPDSLPDSQAVIPAVASRNLRIAAASLLKTLRF